MATTELAEELRGCGAGLLLGQAGRLARRRFKAALAPTGLKPAHTAILVELRERGPTTQQELGGVVDVDPSNLVALLNEVEAEGLAERRRDPDDRRRHIVEISKAGTAQLAEVDRAVAVAEEELMGDLDEEERGQLRTLLSRIVKGAEPESCVDDPAV